MCVIVFQIGDENACLQKVLDAFNVIKTKVCSHKNHILTILIVFDDL